MASTIDRRNVKEKDFTMDDQPSVNILLLLSGELLAERCRTDDLMPSIGPPAFAFLQAAWTPKFWG